MLDQIAPEICAHIFHFACRDSGYTGRSLSLVSRYIHEASKPAKLQSIALFGRAQILAFAELLDQTPAHLRATRYLFINGQESEVEMQKVFDTAYEKLHKAQLERQRYLRSERWSVPPLPSGQNMTELEVEVERQQAITTKYLDDFGGKAARAVESILLNLAPTLQVLDLALNEIVARKMSNPISLPHLADLTTRCGFPLYPLLYPPEAPVLEPSHSLHRLHIVESSASGIGTRHLFENGISHFAPSLTQLQLSQLHRHASITDLESALSAPNSDLTQLPSTLELVVVKPAVTPEPWEGCFCCDDTEEYRDLVKEARRLRDKDRRVVLLQADATLPAENASLREWIKNVDGGVWHWDTSNMDMPESETLSDVDEE
ncbi:hypothetical protein B0H19DRAFT_1116686 [Mycena capillaripes]|nr:hypothetical protein B0H19DRAFT_1116686 [Mycena capillaripes]